MRFKIQAGPTPNARQYFDGAAWHPYIGVDATMTTWVTPNNNIHASFANYGDLTIPVILSETGYPAISQSNASAPCGTSTVNCKWMNDTFALTQQQMPWVSAIIWFRAFNDPRSIDNSFGVLLGPTSPTSNPTYVDTAASKQFCISTGCANPRATQY